MKGLVTPIKIKDKLFYFSELNVQDYKIILKGLLEEPINTFNLIFNVNKILQKITTLSLEELLNLNLLEYLNLLVNIRSSSIGNKIFAVHQDKDKKTKLEIPLNQTINELDKIIKIFNPIFYKENDITIYFNIPSIKDLLYSNMSYIEKISYKDKDYYNVNEEFVNNLPAKYIKVINNNILKINEQVEQYYFYNSPVEFFSIKLSLNEKIYSNIIKILFNENLASIYENIFYLSKICNLDSAYLENCTYGEFKIFVKKAEEMLRKKAQTSQQTNSIPPPTYNPVNIDSFYGPQNGIDVTPSEFMNM